MICARHVPNLRADTRGAMMVIGLVMAVFLTAALYYVVGIAEAVEQRETMQDAADAGAFSAAVLHARGMNVIALVNMLMAALLAILVALKLLETVLGIAIVLLAAAAFFTGGATASSIPTVETLRERVRTAHGSLRPSIHTALETLHATARGVRAVVPWMAQVRVLGVIREHGPHARAGFALPGRAALPTVDGTFSMLCDEAGDYVGRVAALAIPDLPAGIDKDVGKAIGDLASARADWFCGAKGAKQPSAKITEKRVLPDLAARRACEEYSPSAHGYDPKEHEALCLEAERAERRSEPNSMGECKTDECEERAERAREACKPTPNVTLRNWVYQKRKVLRKWGLRNGKWRKITDEEIGKPVLVRPDAEDRVRTPPCGDEDATIGPDWNEETHDGSDAEKALPVCTQEISFPSRGSYYQEEITEVTNVFGCLRVQKRKITADEVTKGDRLDTGNSDEKKTPQVIEDSVLGGDTYQVRALALGTLPRAAPEGVVKVASWSAKTTGVLRDVAARLGRLSFAQAEYFYAVEHPKEPDSGRWLWNMRWTARLRRFRVPSGEPDPATDVSDEQRSQWGIDAVPRDVTGACDQAASDDDEGAELPACGSLLDELGGADELILH